MTAPMTTATYGLQNIFHPPPIERLARLSR